MKYDFIKEQNAFYALCNKKKISPFSQLMWYKLFAFNNSVFGDGYVEVSNMMLSTLIGVESLSKVSRARDELINLGLIDYIPGKRGSFGLYRLNPVYDILCRPNVDISESFKAEKERKTEKTVKDDADENDTDNDNENESVCESETGYENENENKNTYIYNKNKTKNKKNIKTHAGICDPAAREEKDLFIDGIKDDLSKEKDKDELAFLKFWQKYPRKEGRERAYRSFISANINEKLLEDILDAVDKASRSSAWKRENGRFVPLAERYIKEKRWQDEIKEDAETSNDTFGDADDFLAAAIRKGLAV